MCAHTQTEVRITHLRHPGSLKGGAVLLLLLLAACRPEPTAVEVTVLATRETLTKVEVTATPTLTPAPTLTHMPSAMPAVTETAGATPTPTEVPIQATVDALAARVTVSPNGDARESIADDDYPALLRQGCDIVRDHYVRDNFNGVDWEAICSEYEVAVESVENQSDFWDLMESLVDELNDDHSRFVRPDRFALEFNLPTDGSGQLWPGFSFSRARENDQLMIWSVCRSGPAADGGLRRGDVVLAINSQDVARGENGYNLTELYALVYAEDADSVTLTLRGWPDGEPQEVTIPFGSAGGCDGWSYGMLSNSPGQRIGYIRIYDFSGNSDENILYAIEQMETQIPLDGLVLDVRHNPGGNSESDIAIFTTGTFGTTGAMRDDRTRPIFRIRGPVRWNETTPMILLTDGASHSAAEYFATAMQQSGRATLVGMPTAGNTEGIIGHNLADGSLIRLAVSTLLLPDGTSLEGTGVIPDVVVLLGEWGLREEPDQQLREALNVLLGQLDN